MKKVVMNSLGVILFYSVIIVGVLLLNRRFSYLNNMNNNSNTTEIAMNN